MRVGDDDVQQTVNGGHAERAREHGRREAHGVQLGHEVADQCRDRHEAAEETRPVGAAEHAVHLRAHRSHTTHLSTAADADHDRPLRIVTHC